MTLSKLTFEHDGKNYEVERGRISSTQLGIEDHGILTCMVFIDYASGGTQGGGGYGFDQYNRNGKTHIGSKGMAIMIRGILEAVGVFYWENLVGKPVLAIREPGFNGYIRGFHSVYNDTYVMFDECFKDDKDA